MPILDNDLMVADELAYGGTPSAIDIGEATSPARGFRGRMFVKGNGSLAGATGLTITDGATDTAGDAHMSITATVAELNAGLEFALPSNTARYVKVALAGSPSAGTWTCGFILNDGQTND